MTDESFSALAAQSFAAERTALSRAQDEADKVLAQFDADKQATRGGRQEQVDALVAEAARHQAELDRLATARIAAEGVVQVKRDRMQCELTTKTPDCPEASGSPGTGPLYKLAKSRAETEMPVQSSSIAKAQMLRDQTKATPDDLRDRPGETTSLQSVKHFFTPPQLSAFSKLALASELPSLLRAIRCAS